MLGYAGYRFINDPTARELPVAKLLFVPELLVPVIILGIILGLSDNDYAYRFRSLLSVLWGVIKAWIAAITLALVVFFLYQPWFPDRMGYVIFTATGMIALTTNHFIVWSALNLYRRSGGSYKNTLIVGTGKLAQLAADEILARPGRGLRILGFLDWDTNRRYWRYRDIPVLGPLSDLVTIGKSRQVDLVIFAVGYRTLSKISGSAQICNRMGLPAIVLTDVLGDVPVRRTAGEFFGRPGVCFDPVSRQSWAVAAKGFLDRVLAGSVLLLLAPVLAVIALVIKCSSEGPVFFKQTRAGLNGRKFTLWKFRTMVIDAEDKKTELAGLNEMSGPVFKIPDDPRVTQFGRFLRRTSIDELPQLINVVKGDMSLVGPRPPLLEEVKRYDGWERRRLSVKPGLTCLWQIGGRNKIDFEEWMNLDLEYIDNWSLKKDAEILVKTIPAVLRGTGAH
jgi:exopolysaccharide biosynthesis polyprenyl glycosylphosphotransferase